MKINSNTVRLEQEDLQQLTSIIEKLAEENNIDNVEEVKIALDQTEGVVKFKIARNQLEEVIKELEEVEKTEEEIAAKKEELHGEWKENEEKEDEIINQLEQISKK